MMKRRKNNTQRLRYVFLHIVISVCCYISVAAQNSVLSQGNFYKIALTESGVYKIDANFLRTAGIDVSKINPQSIKIYGNGGAMLTQKNKDYRPKDLIENAIFVQGEDDSRFDENDYVLFYGESPHIIGFDTTNKRFNHQINIYSDSTFYFLNTTGDANGLRVKTSPSIAEKPEKIIDSFDSFRFHELEQKNINNSGRTWFGEYFGGISEQSFDIKIDSSVLGSPVTINSALLSVSQTSKLIQLKANGKTLGSHDLYPIKNDEYGIRGIEDSKIFLWENDGSSVLKLTYSNSQLGEAYLNYFEIQAKQKLQFYVQQSIVRAIESKDYTTVKYKISQTKAGAQVWDITNPLNPLAQTLERNGTEASFSSNTLRQVKTFVCFYENNLLYPQSIKKIPNQNLHAPAQPVDLLIITPSIWLEQAQRLARFRQKNDSLRVLVSTVDAIYNEFSSGLPDITAVRDYVRSIWKQDPQKLKYLLLFGDATFDYKNLKNLSKPNNYVPVYESRESLLAINTYSSDDYFGFFQENDGEWIENNKGNHQLDIGVGRLPIKTIDEAVGVVDKLINYANQKKTIGKWRNQISFVADDGDYNLHQKDAESLSKAVVANNKNFKTNKIYVDAYPQTITPNGAKAPLVNNAIVQAINKGSLLINYNGHGGVADWAEENIFTLNEIQALRNANNLALFVTATCQFGRYDDPASVSGGELLMLNRQGGACALFTTTRPVWANTNYLIDSVFYKNFTPNSQYELPRLGDLIKKTKNNALGGYVNNQFIESGVSNRNYTLLGDPSMALTYPKEQLKINQINGKDVEKDTLKALSMVKITGSTSNDFNGIVFVSVFDKASIQSTLGAKGQNGPKMAYSLYKNKIFEGNADVVAGKFQISFMVPKDIVYAYGKGLVQLYAVNVDSTRDAIGSTDAIIVGGSEQQINSDNKAPIIKPYLNDSSFRDGNIVGQTPLLVANVSDESGINISQASIGHEITLTLNDTLQYVLNDYFTANANDFTKGVIVFPFQKLKVGSYNAKLKVWDNYNNSAEAAFNFRVEDEPFRIIANKLVPNPVDSKASFEIKHNRAGDDLNLRIDIIDASGKTLHKLEKNYYNCEAALEGISLDANDLSNGIYFYRITLSSLTQITNVKAFGRFYYLK